MLHGKFLLCKRRKNTIGLVQVSLWAEIALWILAILFASVCMVLYSRREDRSLPGGTQSKINKREMTVKGEGKAREFGKNVCFIKIHLWARVPEVSLRLCPFQCRILPGLGTYCTVITICWCHRVHVFSPSFLYFCSSNKVKGRLNGSLLCFQRGSPRINKSSFLMTGWATISF